jgi:hypothetical protein
VIFYLVNGNELAPTQADARKLDPSFTQIDVPTDKVGLMGYINQLLGNSAGFTDRDESEPTVEVQPVIQTVVLPASYSLKSTEVDAAFQNLPLTHQLTLASLALEKARDIIRC